MSTRPNFDVEIIDFEYLERITEENKTDRPRFFTSMISDIFLTDCEGNVSKDISIIKKHQHGTFEKLLEFIGNKAEEGTPFIYVDDIIKVLPSLQ